MTRARAARAPRANRTGVACLDCGTDLRVTREPHKYSLHPKWSVTIADAEVRRCPKCGYFEVVIPKPDALHRTIAAEVIRKSRRNPSRLESLLAHRSSACRRQSSLEAIGVVHESISRWGE